jgi:hypothetical protein
LLELELGRVRCEVRLVLAAVGVGERSTERVLGREIWLGEALEHCWSSARELGCGLGVADLA